MPTALSLVNQAYEEGWEELDLSGMDLTELLPARDRTNYYGNLLFVSPILDR